MKARSAAKAMKTFLMLTVSSMLTPALVRPGSSTVVVAGLAFTALIVYTALIPSDVYQPAVRSHATSRGNATICGPITPQPLSGPSCAAIAHSTRDSDTCKRNSRKEVYPLLITGMQGFGEAATVNWFRDAGLWIGNSSSDPTPEIGSASWVLAYSNFESYPNYSRISSWDNPKSNRVRALF